MVDQQILANNFFQLRKACGLSQIELADRCNLTNDDIDNIEHGKKIISADELIQIADALCCNPCDLLLFVSKEAINQISAEVAL